MGGASSTGISVPCRWFSVSENLHSHLAPIYPVPVQSQLNPSEGDTLQVPLFLHSEEQLSESSGRKFVCIEFILYF